MFHASLRAKQAELALEKGNVAMLIWLGKQYLGQSDRIEQNTKVSITLSRQQLQEARESLKRIQAYQAEAIDAEVVETRTLEAPRDAGT